MRHPLIGEWLTVDTAVWTGTRGGYDMWELWGVFGSLPFKLTAHVEHRRAIAEAGHDVSQWPKKEKRGKKIRIPPVTVLGAWNKGLSFDKVEPAGAGVGD